MSSTAMLARLTAFLTMFHSAAGHAYVYWPESRNLQIAPHIAHCFNVPGPAVSFQSAHNAGGKAGPSDFAKGMCGNFGQFGPKSTIAEDGIANWAAAAPVATYQSGGTITFTIVNNAEHGGHYEFRLCDRKLDASIGSREDAARCFDAHFLGRQCVPQCGCDSDRCKSNAEHNSPNDPIYSHGPPRHLQQGGHQVEVSLPAGLTCETCTIQWFWHTAWGEQFWNCIDVRIEGQGGPTLSPTSLITTLAPVTTTPSSSPGSDGPCIWTTPAGRQVQMRKQNEKPGRICWEFTVPMGTTVHYQAKVDIYHSWNTEKCCLAGGSSVNIVTFTPQWGNFGFCECIGWTPSTGSTTCAGQATPANMICPVAGGQGSMCKDTSALMSQPSDCSTTIPSTMPPVSTLPPVSTFPPTASPRAHTCADLCSISPSPGSCSSFTDEKSCHSHYFKMSTYAVPCSWIECGECIADGGGALDCPQLDTLCASECKQLCGKSDLTLAAKTCADLSDDENTCVRSFISRAGKRMPCKWTDCTCYADGEILLECDNLDALCEPALLTVA